ncbi:hypothetical protein [Alkalicoccobacillus plakortidis]|uniref:Short chain dehydrogenase n=1 Tax=Alkalicoccobacillus plakortidis TaxID=444060 RepID=A0ABT0XE53_9BACI|nr:hypothetical protein [Alkalicoccobacillus plakortidis]MCM2674162.1 hypothetical protein [Alkalicoccobacillus plakortidis]
MKNVLIFGGTGMLLQTTKWLDRQTENVVVFGRTQSKNAWLVERKNKVGFEFYKLDYQETDKLKLAIHEIVSNVGVIDCVVAWIHSGAAPKALSTILDELQVVQQEPYHLFHIKGSSESIKSIQTKMDVPANCLYREVLLGFYYDGQQSRWLTHHEISTGVIEAISEDVKTKTIGVLTPWEKRP